MVFADVHITEEGVALELLAVMRSLVAITVIMRRRWSSLFQVIDSRKLPFCLHSLIFLKICMLTCVFMSWKQNSVSVDQKQSHDIPRQKVEQVK